MTSFAARPLAVTALELSRSAFVLATADGASGRRTRFSSCTLADIDDRTISGALFELSRRR